jgi:hypothetical protein
MTLLLSATKEYLPHAGLGSLVPLLLEEGKSLFPLQSTKSYQSIPTIHNNFPSTEAVVGLKGKPSLTREYFPPCPSLPVLEHMLLKSVLVT